MQVISTASNTVTATIPMPGSGDCSNCGSDPLDIAVSPNGQRVYVTNFNFENLVAVNTFNNTASQVVIGIARTLQRQLPDPAGVSRSARTAPTSTS